MAFLVLRDPSGEQREVALDEDAERIVIGRRSACELPLSWDERVSRVHAVLERLGGDWCIRDDGLSRNGTFLNGERVQASRALADGDVIAIGHTHLTFRAAATSLLMTRAGSGSAAISVTPAQRRVLVALCRPLLQNPPSAAPASNREIADELVVSVETVKSHLGALFERFGLQEPSRNRAELARGTIRLGLVSERDVR